VLDLANVSTPIQNNIEELYSLFRFLRAKPLDDWDNFRDRIAKLVKNGQTKVAMKRLQVVLRAIMLRRAKDATLGECRHDLTNVDGKPILVLPGRKVDIVPCVFDSDEKAFYDALEQKSSLTFNKVSQLKPS
jgi:SNF2 family DNA or RNA helicase